MHQCITTPPPESDLQSLGRARGAKRSRGGCRGLAPVLFLPVSPHGLVVFHDDAELGPRVQCRALQVPFEALQGRRGERASAAFAGGKLSPELVLFTGFCHGLIKKLKEKTDGSWHAAFLHLNGVPARSPKAIFLTLTPPGQG